jgi:hypothetical protein
MQKKKTLPEIIITELFLVKADWERTFMGEIRRETDSNGNPIIIGKVVIMNGTAWSSATTEEELRKNMDDLCKMKLDGELHLHPGITIKISDIEYFLN